MGCLVRGGPRKRRRAACAIVALLSATALSGAAAHAQDATWLTNPASGDFNTAGNWSPATVPSGTAFFGASQTTSLSLSANTTIGGWTFNAGAPLYSFNNGNVLQFTGAGIFSNFNGTAAIIDNSDEIDFNNNSSALGNVDVDNNGTVTFNNNSTAGNATITNQPGTETVSFNNNSTAGSAHIGNAATVSFNNNSTAGSATITNTGTVFFNNNSTGGSAVILNLSNLGVVDFSNSAGPNGDHKLSIGELADEGSFYLGANQLTITHFGGNIIGVISDCGVGGNACTNAGASGGSLVFNGGTTLGGINTYTGATTVNATLEVDGSIASSSLTTVNSGGTLTGAGTVSGTTVAGGGTLTPGGVSTVGTMTVAGNLVLQSAATYMVFINGTNASFANVSGTATLTGAAFAVSNRSAATLGKDLVLQSSAPITTQFANSSVTLSGGLRGMLDYTTNPDDVYLDVSLGTLVPLLPATPPQNVVNVANAIDNYIAGGGNLPAGFQNIFNFTPQQLQTALSQLSGESSTGAATGTFQLVNNLLDLLSDMALGTGGGGGSNGGGASGFAEPDEALPPELALAYNTILKKAPPAPASLEQRWTAWGSGFGGAANYNGNAVIGSNNLTASDFGFAGGLDYHAAPDLKLGFAAAGGGTNWSLAQNLGSGRSDAFQIAGYAIKHYGPLYLTGTAALGDSWLTTNRTAANGDQLRASFVGQSYALRGEAGYRFAVTPMAGVAPYGALQTQWFHTPGYSETDLTGGGFGLTFGSQSANDTRTELGARADDLTTLNNLPLILRARLAWAHDSISNAALGAVFQALPGAAFTVRGASVPANSALTSVGTQLFFTRNWSFEAKFEGEFASTAQTYSGSGTVRYAW